jgi:hypothetical protein
MCGVAMAAIATLSMAGAGWPQGAAPPPTLGIREPDAQPTPPPSPQPNQESPGLLDGLGKLFEKSLSVFPTLKGLGESADDFNARAKDAGDSMSRLAKPSTMVAGRAICPASTNGAPDCKLGADKLCQTRGFKQGKSLNTDSAETCSPKTLIPGRGRKPDDCRTDNFVTSALCQ